jgi:hypothetical protein
MSAKVLATVRRSPEKISRHGGLSAPHKDGRGIAWYDDREIRAVKETLSGAWSAADRRGPPQGMIGRGRRPCARGLTAVQTHGDSADAPRQGLHRYRRRPEQHRPVLGSVGLAGKLRSLSDFQTWVCSFARMAGRLELLSVLVLFTPTFWRH